MTTTVNNSNPSKISNQETGLKNNVKPLFKYIGGKSWLRDKLRNAVKETLVSSSNSISNTPITTYVEPFSGALGAFLNVFDILLEQNVKNIQFSDTNKNIINLYKDIYISPDVLIREIISLEQHFEKSVSKDYWNLSQKIRNNTKEAKPHLQQASDVYFQVRSDFNSNKEHNNIQQSARLAFLQRHAFNGVYRENRKGEHNVPFNWNGASMDEDTIAERIYDIHACLHSFEKVEFLVCSYEHLDFSNPEALYYLDPPYLNEVDAYENKYQENSFELKEQLDLINKLGSSKHFIYSNHNVPILIEAIKRIQHSAKQTFDFISRKNIMSASSESRKTDKQEILVIHNKN